MNNGTIDNDLADLLGEVDKDVAEQKEMIGPEEDMPAEEPRQTGPVKPVILPAVKKYLKTVIEGQESAEYTQRLIDQLDKAMNSPVREDRTLYKQRLMATYWNFLGGVLERINQHLAVEKVLCIRYGLVDIDLLKPQQVQLIKSIPLTASNPEYPFFYMDEWLKQVADGKIKPSMMDETQGRKTGDSGMQEKIDRKLDSRGALLTAIRSKVGERELIEKGLQSYINTLTTHNSMPEYDNLPEAYTAEQKEIMNKVVDDFRKLKTIDLAMLSFLREMRGIDSEVDSIKNKLGGGGGPVVDSKLVLDEFNSLRQMIKMCAGPRGNHFPILIGDYMPPGLEYMNTRENTVKLIQNLEKRDGEIFFREFKGQKNRIVPYIILVPGYGEKGVCWEPFDIRQRATSRGRIALPLYPRNPMVSLLYAVADLRWQVAKEKAGHRWMEEGLTGKYYNYFSEAKLKGNIRDAFVLDYIIWVTQEWNGTQKLERVPRDIFWRFIPFPQDKKEELKTKGFFYAELYKKDLNRSRSDGY